MVVLVGNTVVEIVGKKIPFRDKVDEVKNGPVEVNFH